MNWSHLLFLSALLLNAAGTAALAMPISPSERAKLFARCAGNLSALAAHQRSVSGKDPTRIEALRDGYDSLLNAILPYAVDYGMPASQAADWRQQAWRAQTVLLNDVAYSIDAGRAKRAQNTARDRIEICHNMLLPNAAGAPHSSKNF